MVQGFGCERGKTPFITDSTVKSLPAIAGGGQWKALLMVLPLLTNFPSPRKGDPERSLASKIKKMSQTTANVNVPETREQILSGKTHHNDAKALVRRVERDAWSQLLSKEEAKSIFYDCISEGCEVRYNFGVTLQHGVNGALFVYDAFKGAFNDLKTMVLHEGSWVEGDVEYVFTRWRRTGTFTGNFFTLHPNSAFVHLDGMSLCKVKNNKITHIECMVDLPAFATLIGWKIPHIFGATQSSFSEGVSNIVSSIQGVASKVAESVGLTGGSSTGGSSTTTGTHSHSSHVNK
jgi:hypothetical protein